MECPECQHENPEDAKFCNQCSHNFSSIADLDNSKVVNENNLDNIRRFLPKGIAEKFQSQKGKNELVAVYKLISAKRDTYRPRIGFERVIYSEMIGKDKELDKVVLQVMKAIDGKGSVVNVIGEAGIGKSRLMAELKIQVLVNKVILLEGRAISIGRNLSYFAITNLLKNWVRIKEDDNDIEYLFKHALAQEADYEPILIQKRKELHLKVAQSIASVFKKRLH